MALQSAFQGVQRIFRELDKHRSYHEKKLTEMSSDEREAEDAKKMDEYKMMCLCGATGMFWNDTYKMTKKLHEYSPAAAGMTSVFTILALVSIVFGVAAATFSRSAPHALAIAANGGLWSMFFVIMVGHLEMMEFLPILPLAILCALVLAVFVGYWHFSARELTVFLMVLKFIVKIFYTVLIAFICMFKCLCMNIMGLFKRNNQREIGQNDGLPLHDFSRRGYCNSDAVI